MLPPGGSAKFRVHFCADASFLETTKPIVEEVVIMFRLPVILVMSSGAATARSGLLFARTLKTCKTAQVTVHKTNQRVCMCTEH